MEPRRGRAQYSYGYGGARATHLSHRSPRNSCSAPSRPQQQEIQISQKAPARLEHQHRKRPPSQPCSTATPRTLASQQTRPRFSGHPSPPLERYHYSILRALSPTLKRPAHTTTDRVSGSLVRSVHVILPFAALLLSTTQAASSSRPDLSRPELSGSGTLTLFTSLLRCSRRPAYDPTDRVDDSTSAPGVHYFDLCCARPHRLGQLVANTPRSTETVLHPLRQAFIITSSSAALALLADLDSSIPRPTETASTSFVSR